MFRTSSQEMLRLLCSALRSKSYVRGTHVLTWGPSLLSSEKVGYFSVFGVMLDVYIKQYGTTQLLEEVGTPTDSESLRWIESKAAVNPGIVACRNMREMPECVRQAYEFTDCKGTFLDPAVIRVMDIPIGRLITPSLQYLTHCTNMEFKQFARLIEAEPIGLLSKGK